LAKLRRRTNDAIVAGDGAGEPAEELTSNSSELSTVLEGLEPNTDYSFQLRAYTSRGPGPWNNRLPFRTFGSCTSLSVRFWDFLRKF